MNGAGRDSIFSMAASLRRPVPEKAFNVAFGPPKPRKPSSPDIAGQSPPCMESQCKERFFARRAVLDAVVIIGASQVCAVVTAIELATLAHRRRPALAFDRNQC